MQELCIVVLDFRRQGPDEGRQLSKVIRLSLLSNGLVLRNNKVGYLVRQGIRYGVRPHPRQHGRYDIRVCSILTIYPNKSCGQTGPHFHMQNHRVQAQPLEVDKGFNLQNGPSRGLE